MQIEVFMRDLMEAGVQLKLEQGRLICQAPKGALTQERQARLREHREQIITFLETLNGVLPTETANAPEVGAEVLAQPRPLSFAQEHLWLTAQIHGQSSAYHMPVSALLDTAVDLVPLRRAAQWVVQKHGALRTSIHDRPDGAVQIVHATATLAFPLIDLSGLADCERDPEAYSSELRRLLKQEAVRPFELACAPLLRMQLIRLSPTQHVFSYTFHHMIADGWSLQVFDQDLMQAALHVGETGRLPTLRHAASFAELALTQRERLQGEALAICQRYWQAQTRDLPPTLGLPQRGHRGRVLSTQGAVARFALDAATSQRVREWARRQGLSTFSTLLALFKLALARYARTQDIVLGTVSANRPDAAAQAAIGYFATTFLLRHQIDPAEALQDFVRRVARNALEAQRYQDLPLERLEGQQVASSLSHSKWFEVLFSMQVQSSQAMQVAPAAARSLQAERVQAKCDLSVSARDEADGFSFAAEYIRDLYDADFVARLFDYYFELLSVLERDAGRCIGELPQNSSREQQLLRALTSPSVAPSHWHVLARLAQHAAKHPESLAVVGGGTSLSYSGLWQNVQIVAAALRAQGLQPQEFVAVSVPRTASLPIAMLAVWLAGGIYLPIDPDYPADRAEQVVADAKPAFALLDGKASPALSGICSIDISTALNDAAHRTPASIDAPTALDAAAYAIYTSGSTGRPKGVVVRHRALSAFIESACGLYGFDRDSRILQFATPNFDASIEEIVGAVWAGACLVLRDASLAGDLAALNRWTDVNQVTVWDLPTAYWQTWLSESIRQGWALPRSLQTVIIGGERVDPQRVREWQQLPEPKPTLFNSYGPTEATVVATAGPIADRQVNGEISIGHALPHGTAVVLDASMRQVPIDVEGDLYLGGVALADGYLHLPASTASAFVPDPFAPMPGSRLYRTGDRAIVRADGSIDFAGRADDQLKIRGFRVEPAEVAAQIQRDPSVVDCTVQARRNDSGGAQLLAYVVLRDRIESVAVETHDSSSATKSSPGHAAYWGNQLQQAVLNLALPKTQHALLQAHRVSVLEADAADAFATATGPHADAAFLLVVGEWLRSLTQQREVPLVVPCESSDGGESGAYLLRLSRGPASGSGMALAHSQALIDAALAAGPMPLTRLRAVFDEANDGQSLGVLPAVLQMPSLGGVRLLPSGMPIPAHVALRLGDTLELTFGPGSIAASAADRFADILCHLFGEAARRGLDAPEAWSLLPKAQADIVVTAWNQRAADLLPFRDVASAVYAQAAVSPNVLAIQDRERQLTYAELCQRADHFAALLEREGVCPFDVIGVCLPRNVDLVAVLLGILRLGATYAPLDPAYPKERLAMMVEDGRVTRALTTMALRERLPESLLCLDLAELLAINPAVLAAPTVPAIHPSSLSHLIYTSGSTGRPKAVAITHGNTLVRLSWSLQAYSDADMALVLFSTSLNFDLSVYELWSPLIRGGCLLVVENILALLESPDLQPVLINTVPSAAKTLLAAKAVPAATRVFNVAGEPLPRQVVNDLLTQTNVERVCNLYGPSEDTTYSTEAIFREPLVLEPSIGKPLPNTRCYVVDADLRPVPIGVAGELLIGGLGQSRCYLGRPELTAEKFVPDSFADAPGGRLYRTGDLVRYRDHGDMEFLGRIDHQVKINGFRIELGEVDACLRQHRLCKDTLVVVANSADGGKRLLAYVVADDSARTDVSASKHALRAHCESGVPPYMVPSDFVLLERFPLSPNGKIDRSKLPQPTSEAGTEQALTAPRTALQKRLHDIWCEVLGRSAVGIEQDFFRLGGNSLLAARVVAQIRHEYGVDWPMTALFAAPTLVAAAERLRQSLAGQGVQARIEPRQSTQSPLASNQRGLWVMDVMGRSGILYNVPLGVDVEGELDWVSLRRALVSLVWRQHSLRLRFVGTPDAPELTVDPRIRAPIAQIDLSGLDRKDAKVESDQLYRVWARLPISVTADPMLFSAGIMLSNGRSRLMFNSPHIVTDGWSLQVFVDELWSHYSDHRQGRALTMPAPAVNFCDFAWFEQEWLHPARLQDMVSAWAQELDDAVPLLELPTDRPRPAVQSYQGECEFFALDQTLRDAVNDACERFGVTQYMLLMAAFALLLTRLSGQNEVVLSTPVANRHQPEIEPLIGMFTSTVPIRLDLGGKQSFSAFLAHVRAQALKALERQEAPFYDVVTALRHDRHLSYAPLSQAMFSMDAPLSVGPKDMSLGIKASEVLDVSVGVSKFDLMMHLEDQGSALAGFLEYNTDIFDRATVARWLAQFRDVVRALVNTDDRPLECLNLFAREDLEHELQTFNQTAHPGLPESDLVSVWRRQVQATPLALALVAGTESWTYAELDRRSDQVAAYLQAQGVGGEDKVGLSMRRDAWLLAALLGVLKAGACYVPLDPSYPEARLRAMVADSKPRCVLCDEVPVAALRDAPGLSPRPVWQQTEGSVTGVAVQPAQLAYVIFTSGSTGRPKVVGISHGNAVNRLGWAARCYSVSEVARVLAGTSLNFDLSVYELWSAWSRGGAVLFVDNVLALSEQTELQPSLINSVPSAVKELVHGGFVPASVQTVNVAGEPLPAALVNALFAKTSVRRVANLYGPSEDTTYSTGVDFYGPVTREPSIGLPLDHGQAYVLDAELQPVPVGVSGELYLGGLSVARGYLGDVAMTARKFVPDPFGPPGARLYRTGDRARRRADGELEFLGRLDHQIKLRGFRIELGEIDACLRTVTGVRDVVVSVRPIQGEQRLIAHVESDWRQEALEPLLHQACRDALPAYMQPSAILVLAKLPTSPNGKIDRAALPIPTLPSRDDAEPPRQGLETALAAIWSEVLGVTNISRQDNFFALGGHSLLAMRMVARIKDRLQCQMSPLDLFTAPTLMAQAELLAPRALLDSAERDMRDRIPSSQRSRAPLSMGQQRLWLIEQMGGGGAVYAMPMALRLRGELNLPALRRAFQILTERHQILRSRIEIVAGQAWQCALPVSTLDIPILDLSQTAGAPLLPQWLAEFGARPFDLLAETFLRVNLVRLSPHDHVLGISMPHLASDAWSMNVLMLEFAAIYRSYHEHGVAPSFDPVLQYVDYSEWQNQALARGDLESSMQFWQRALTRAPRYLPLPTSKPRPMHANHRGGTVKRRLQAETMQQIRRFAKQQGTTASSVMATSLMLALSRLAAFPDVVIGMPVSNRDQVELEGVIGFFANTMVLRAAFAPAMTLKDALQAVHMFSASALAHAQVPFDKVVELSAVQRVPGYSPLFQVMFNYLASAGVAGNDDPLGLPGLEIEGLAGTGAQFAKFDLTFFVNEDGLEAGCGLEYRQDLYSAAAAEGMLQAVFHVLDCLITTPEAFVSALILPPVSDLTHRPERPLSRFPTEWEQGVIENLYQRLRDTLPDYMVPDTLIALDALPLNANGKVDRAALPVPDVIGLGTSAYEAPEPGIESRLAQVWQEVLKVPKVGRRDSFFGLGGHSLLAMQLVARVREQLQAELSLLELFSHPTLAAQAHILSTRVGRVGDELVPVASGADRHPASFAQRRLWFIEQMKLDSGSYVIPAALRLSGTLSLPALRVALHRLVARHEVLRTAFVEATGQVWQQVLPIQDLAIPVLDAGLVDPEVLALAWLSWVDFDLADGRLFRAAVLRVSATEHWLLLQMHHIVSDAWSMQVLWTELSALYAGALDDGPTLPRLAVQYGDYARWQQAWLAGERLQAAEQYWQEALSGAPQVLRLPVDRPRPLVQSHRGAALVVSVPASVRAGVQAFCQRHDVTMFMAMLAPFAQLLGRLAGQEEVLLGVPMSNRSHQVLEGLIGFFVNTLVLRLGPDQDPTVAAAMTRVRHQIVSAYAHQDLPFERLVELLNPERDPGRTPLFQVMYSLDQEAESVLTAPDGALQIGSAPLMSDPVAKFDLSLNLKDARGQLTAVFTYNRDLFDADTIQRWADYYLLLVEQWLGTDSRQPRDMILLNGDARAQLLAETAMATKPFPTDRALHGWIEHWAAETPDATAVVAADGTLSYAALNHAANTLAWQLLELGIKADDRVAILADRGAAQIVSILAIWKAGGAYVPLDLNYPDDRLRYMLEDSAPTAVLVGKGLAPRLAELAPGTPHVTIHLAASGVDRGNPMRSNLNTHALAYVIYTSGSTGRPKGVMVEHHSVLNLWTDLERQVFSALPRTARIGLNGSLSFDGSVKSLTQLLSGRCVVVVPQMIRQDASAMVSYLQTHRVDAFDCTPSHLEGLLSAGLQDGVGHRPGTVLIGGEAIGDKLWTRLASDSRCQYVNVYGPTECTVDATLTVIRESESPHIGRPMANVQIYIVDAAGQLVPRGTVGEIWIGGIGVSRGYLNQPELTREKFLADPFLAVAGARVYRTGDLGRWRHDGGIDYLGRSDFQVKLRGYRIELGEIEAALNACAGVSDSTVIVRELAAGDQRLIAYYREDATAPVQAATLRDALSERLADYMVPAAFVRMTSWPLTPNGKLDRAALPPPDSESFGRSDFEAPEPGIESRLAQVWQEVLKVPKVGRRDSFFGLGGHSLLAMQLVARVREQLQAELSLLELFSHPTLAAQAHILSTRVGRVGDELVPVASGADRHPASFAQRRLWFIEQMKLDSGSYVIPAALRLSGTLSLPALRVALHRLVARHEVLRTAFVEATGQVWQQVLPIQDLAIPVLDAGLVDPEVLALAWLSWVDFDLADGRLFRAAVLRVSATEHWLLLQMHHIVSDAWSMQVLWTELSALYAGALDDGPTLPRLAVQYGDYARWQQAWLAGERLQAAEQYWQEALSGAPQVLRLPVDRPRPLVQSHRGAALVVSVPASVRAGVQAFCQRHDVTMFMAMLAPFAQLLGRLAGQEEVLLGVPMSNRSHQVLEGLIGFFVNTLVLRLGPDQDPTVAAAMTRVRHQIVSAYAHQDLPFERLVELLNPERDPGRTPLFQVMYSLDQEAESVLTAPDGALQIGSAPLMSDPVAKFDLSLNLKDARGQLTAVFTYNRDLFDADTIQRWADYYLLLVEQWLRADRCKPQSMGLLDAEAIGFELQTFNQTAHPGLPESDLVSVWRRQVQATPLALALVAGTESWTYADLDRRSDQVAAYLQAQGVGGEDKVGLSMRRDAWLLAALLGVLKAGACYVPLDPSYPEARLRAMVADSKPRCVLCDEVPVAALRDAPGLSPRPVWQQTEGSVTGVAVQPAQLAYVIFTSGSTGRPKVVGISHGNAVNRLGWAARCYSVSEVARVLAGTSLNFDLSVYELWSAWSRGGAVLFVDNVLALSEQTELQPSLINSVPSAVKELVHGGFVPASVQTVNVAGEPLPAALVNALFAKTSVRRVANLYGPSEDTTYSTGVDFYGPVTREPSIGLPLDHGQAYVLDAELQPVPVGVSGELYLGGLSVARGYLGDVAMTARKFVPDPFGPPGARLYRTGDRARRRADGELEFLGRLDHQIKLRGFRIELGEIDACLRTVTGVRDVVVSVRPIQGEQRLIAHVESDWRQEALEPLLHQACRDALPAYMQPSAILVLAKLPTSPNGKIDRAALPIPTLPSRDDAEPPRQGLETALAAIWSEVLGVTNISRQDNFFALGGHSLLAVRLVRQIRDKLGTELALVDLFRHISLAALADAMRSRQGPAWCATLKDPDHATGTLVLVHPIGGSVQAYHDLSALLPDTLRVLAIESPMLHGDAPAHSLEALAERYVGAVHNQCGTAPIFLGGWSLGGVIAAAMAKQLGAQCQGVVMIDSFAQPGAIGDLPAMAAQILARELGLKQHVLESHELGPDFETRLHRAALMFNRVPDGTTHDDVARRLHVLQEHLRLWQHHRSAAIEHRLVYFGAKTCTGMNSFDAYAPYQSIAIAGADHDSIVREPYLQAVVAHLTTFLTAENNHD